MEILLFLVSVVKVVHTMGAITLLQHKKIHPIPIDCECGKLHGDNIIKGGAIDCLTVVGNLIMDMLVLTTERPTYNLVDVLATGQKAMSRGGTSPS